MSRIPVFPSAVWLIFMATAARGADPGLGSSRTEVLDELGKPTATIKTGAHELMMFPRGRVTLENGKVIELTIKTREEYAEEESRRNAQAQAKLEAEARKREAAELRRAEAFLNKKTGEEELTRIVNEPAWLKYTGEERLEILERLRRKYPEADLEFEFSLAKAKRDRSDTQRAQLLELQRRLIAAEQRAEAAEAKAAQAMLAADRSEATARAAAQAAATERITYLPRPIVISPHRHNENTVCDSVRLGDNLAVSHTSAQIRSMQTAIRNAQTTAVTPTPATGTDKNKKNTTP